MRTSLWIIISRGENKTYLKPPTRYEIETIKQLNKLLPLSHGLPESQATYPQATSCAYLFSKNRSQKVQAFLSTRDQWRTDLITSCDGHDGRVLPNLWYVPQKVLQNSSWGKFSFFFWLPVWEKKQLQKSVESGWVAKWLSTKYTIMSAFPSFLPSPRPKPSPCPVLTGVPAC